MGFLNAVEAQHAWTTKGEIDGSIGKSPSDYQSSEVGCRSLLSAYSGPTMNEMLWSGRMPRCLIRTELVLVFLNPWSEEVVDPCALLIQFEL